MMSLPKVTRLDGLAVDGLKPISIMHRLVISLLLGLTQISSARTFTDVQGRKLEAEIVSVEANSVRIRRADGQVFSLPLSTLSAEDNAYIQKWKAAAPPAAPVVKPTAPLSPAEAKKAADAENRRQLHILEDVLTPDWTTNKTTRWKALPVLRLSSDDPELGKFVEALFAEAVQISGLQPAPGERIVEVHIGPQEKLKKLITKETERISMREGFTTWCFWSDQYDLGRSLVMFSHDMFEAKDRKEALTAAMLFAFGLVDYSKEIKPEDKSPLGYDFAGVEAFGELDKRMLAFLYKHLPSGTPKTEMRSLFRKHWQP